MFVSFDVGCTSLTNGCAVRLTGHLVPSPGKGQSHELVVDERKGGVLEVLGACNPDVSTLILFLKYEIIIS